jgi:hypothetical protein
MLWNAIRNHIHYRLPGIIDFVLFVAAMTMIAAVLLGLVAIYVEYGLAVFGVAVAIFCVISFLAERRSPVYYERGSDKLMLPPGKQALPQPGPPQIGRAPPAITSTQRRALPGPKK